MQAFHELYQANSYNLLKKSFENELPSAKLKKTQNKKELWSFIDVSTILQRIDNFELSLTARSHNILKNEKEQEQDCKPKKGKKEKIVKLKKELDDIENEMIRKIENFEVKMKSKQENTSNSDISCVSHQEEEEEIEEKIDIEESIDEKKDLDGYEITFADEK